MATTAPANGPVPANVKSVIEDKDIVRKAPQASTCVALGDLHLNSGMDPHFPAQQRPHTLELARKCYQEAIKTDANNKEAYHGLARVYDELKDHDRMVATYQKAIKTWPKDATFCFDFGMAEARHKNWQPALANLNAACELDAENRAYKNTYAYTLARAGQLDDSLAVFRKVGSEAEAQYNLARMLHHMNHDDQSRQHLQLALEADPKMTPARQMLAALSSPSAPAVKAEVTVGFEAPANMPGTSN